MQSRLPLHCTYHTLLDLLNLLFKTMAYLFCFIKSLVMLLSSIHAIFLGINHRSSCSRDICTLSYWLIHQESLALPILPSLMYSIRVIPFIVLCFHFSILFVLGVSDACWPYHDSVNADFALCGHISVLSNHVCQVSRYPWGFITLFPDFLI